MPAYDKNLFRVFTATNLSDDICCFRRPIGKVFLNVNSTRRRNSSSNHPSQLPLIFARKRNNRQRKTRIKPKNAGVRQFHPCQTQPPLPADDGNDSRIRKRLQKISKLGED